jgi:hypothetical protein
MLRSRAHRAECSAQRAGDISLALAPFDAEPKLLIVFGRPPLS